MKNFIFFKKLRTFFYSTGKFLEIENEFSLKNIKLDFFIYIFMSVEIIRYIKVWIIQINLNKKVIDRKIKKKYSYYLKNNMNENLKNKINFFSKDCDFLFNNLNNILPIRIIIKILTFKNIRKKKSNSKHKKNLGFFKKKRNQPKIKQAYNKKFICLFDFNLPEFQQYQGYFNFRGQRIKKFSMIWDEAKWIFCLFIGKKFEYFLLTDIVRSYLDNLFMILIFIQTGKMNNFFFFYKNYKNSNKEYSIELSFFYKLFILDRKWNVNFSRREKMKNIYQHLTCTTDMCIDNILNSKRKFLNLNINAHLTDIDESKIPVFYYLHNTKCQMSLIDFITLNIYIFISNKNKQFFVINDKKLNLINVRKKIIQNFLFGYNYDFRIWHNFCLDSYLIFFQNKIKAGIFLFLFKKIKNFLFDFLLYQFYKKIFQFQIKEFQQINIKKEKLFNFFNKKTNFLLENLKKLKTINNNFQTNLFIYFSKKKFVQENKILFTKIFKNNFLFISIFLFKGLYCISSYQHFHFFNHIVIMEMNTLINEILILKFYKLFKCHGNNPFIHDNRLKEAPNCICFLEIYNQNISSFNRFIYISFSVAKSNNLHQMKKFRILLIKKRLIDTVIFFCTKYRINYIIIENNSFLERSVSVFLKTEIFKQTILCNSLASNSIFINQKKNLNYIQILTLENDTIIFNIANSNTFRDIYPNYTERILFLVIKFLNQNIIAYSVLLLIKKIDINLKLNQKFWTFKYDRLYKIITFVFFFTFSRTKININYILKKRNKRNLLNLLNIFGRRKGYKFSKKILSIFKMNKNLFFSFLKLKKKENCWAFIIFFFYLKKILTSIKRVNEISTLFYLLSSFKKNNVSSIFNNPFIFKDFIRIFNIKILKEKFAKSFDISPKLDFYKFLNKSILTYSSSNFILLDEKKKDKFKTKNNNKKNTLLKKSNILLRSMKEKILLNHQIGQIIIINNVKKVYKNYFFGLLETGFCYFINQKDFLIYNLNFKNFIISKISCFPAKIIAIYPSIMKIRLSLVGNKKYFF
jgi:hypothetical protein